MQNKNLLYLPNTYGTKLKLSAIDKTALGNFFTMAPFLRFSILLGYKKRIKLRDTRISANFDNWDNAEGWDAQEDPRWDKDLEEPEKIIERFEIDPVLEEKLLNPDSTQNSLKNFPYFRHYLRMFIFYWIEYGTSQKFLFVEKEFGILSEYKECLKRSVILIQDEHPNQNLDQMLTAAGDLLGDVTTLFHIIHYNCIAGHARNANDPDTSEMEKLLSMGAAYIQLFTKAFFIVAIWIQKKTGPDLLQSRKGVLDQLITELLTSSTPGQILLPDELKSSAALSKFIEMLFRFDEHLDF